ncbi:MAG TPA: acyltransferase [Thermobifida alba]|nr:acyltransferase [Thermobifida alba]
MRPAGTGTPGTARLYYLDNLRLFLIVLVVILHAAQPYGPADWWYVEGTERAPALARWTTVGGTFLMSLFFLVSAYFVPAAHDRRGGARLLGERVRRFLPLILVGFFVIVPVLMYAYYLNFRDHQPLGPLTYYTDVYLGAGERPSGWTGPIWPDRQFAHLWFIQHLLVYVLLYTVSRWAVGLRGRTAGGREDAAPPAAGTAPGTAAVIGFTAALAAATFLLRVWYPVDTWVPVLEFIQTEPADLALQASFFAAGIMAYRRGWLSSFGDRAGYAWLAVGTALAAAHIGFGDRLDTLYAPGGWTGGSLLWSVVESVMCVSLSIGLLALFRRWARRSGPVLAGGAALVFTVYVIHVPVVVALQYAAGDLGAWGGFAVAASGGVLLSFALAWAVNRTPVLRRVL